MVKTRRGGVFGGEPENAKDVHLVPVNRRDVERFWAVPNLTN